MSLDLRFLRAWVLFWSWERSFWHWTVRPVGSCVMRTAESVVFTDWPPWPLARKVSILRSSSFISSSCSSISGVISTRTKDVSRVLPELKGLSLTRRWTPCSSFRKPYAKGPLMRSSALFIPASSAIVFSEISTSHSLDSA